MAAVAEPLVLDGSHGEGGGHLETVAWVARRFVPVSVELRPGRPSCVCLAPRGVS